MTMYGLSAPHLLPMNMSMAMHASTFSFFDDGIDGDVCQTSYLLLMTMSILVWGASTSVPSVGDGDDDRVHMPNTLSFVGDDLL